MKTKINLMSAYILFIAFFASTYADEQSKINIITAESPNSCSVLKQCNYKSEVVCSYRANMEDDADSVKNDCYNSIREQAAENNGDTIVIQKQGVVKGYTDYDSDQPDYYRLFGQVYNCASGSRPTRTSAIRFITTDYARQCDLNSSCKIVVSDTCSSVRSDPFEKCVTLFTTRERYKANNTSYIAIHKEFASDNIYRYSYSFNALACR